MDLDEAEEMIGENESRINDLEAAIEDLKKKVSQLEGTLFSLAKHYNSNITGNDVNDAIKENKEV